MSLERTVSPILALLIAVGLGSCAASGSLACRPDEKRLVSDTLHLGTARQGGVVDAAQWTQFLRDWVTPRFPDGLTVSQASGQWRGADGTIVEETSYVLNLVHASDEESERKVGEIASEYKRRFDQEAVLRTRSVVCVSL